MASDDAERPRPGDAPLHPRRRRAARRRWLRRRVRGRADGAQPRHRGPGARPAAEDPLGRAAAPRRARPDPVLRGRHAAPRRADQPPRRRLHRLAARVPQGPPGRPGRDQPRHRAAGDHRQPGAAPRREPRGDRRLQHGLERRTSPSARPTRSAASASGINAESKAKTLTDQANRMRAKATKAQAAQSMLKRAERLLGRGRGRARSDRVARIKFPAPAPCGKTPLTAAELSKSYGSLEVFTDVDLAIDRGSRVVVLGLNGAGKTTLLRILAGARPRSISSSSGMGLPLSSLSFIKNSSVALIPQGRETATSCFHSFSMYSRVLSVECACRAIL